MSALSSQQFKLYHGTSAKLDVGDIVHPLSDESPVWSTTSPELARTYGEHVYHVSPVEPADLYHDHSVGDAKNYATAYGYEVLGRHE